MGGSSDPYFVFFLAEYPVASRKTEVTNTHLYPTYDFTKDTAVTKLKEPLTLPLTVESLAKLRSGELVLHVEVWDKDPVRDSFLVCLLVCHRTGGFFIC